MVKLVNIIIEEFSDIRHTNVLIDTYMLINVKEIEGDYKINYREIFKSLMPNVYIKSIEDNNVNSLLYEMYISFIDDSISTITDIAKTTSYLINGIPYHEYNA